MTTISLRLPDSVHKKLRELAERDGVSINQFIATAAAEKAAALLTADYLEERGRQGDAVLFDRLLERVPDVPPAPGDELPAGLVAESAVAYRPEPDSRPRSRSPGRRTRAKTKP